MSAPHLSELAIALAPHEPSGGGGESGYASAERRSRPLGLPDQGMVFRALADASGQGVVMMSMDGRISYANPALIRILDEAGVHTMLGRRFASFYPIALQQRLAEEIIPAVLRGENWCGEMELVSGSGRYTPTLENFFLVRDTHNAPVCIANVITDVRDLKRAELNFTKLSSAVEHSGSAILIANVDGTVEYVNPRFSELSGARAVDVVGRSWLALLPEGTPDSVREGLDRAIIEETEWRDELCMQRPNGERVWTLVSISPVTDEWTRRTTHFVLVAEDVTALKAAQQRMTALAFQDSLTGLDNRRLFLNRLGQTLKVIQRDGSQAGLLFLDIDHFKRVNDTLGHEAGDALLSEIGRRLRSCVRASDSVARIGGDEFAVLVQDVPRPSSLAHLAEKILLALQEPCRVGGESILITASIGIAVPPTDGDEIETLMRNVDLAMYRAKEIGRNNYQFFTTEMNRKAVARLTMENELRRAMRRNEFTLVFQPIVDLASGVPVAIESLLRWRHPDRGLLAPTDFIPLAEEIGLIVPLGDWVLRTACLSLGALRSDLSVTVNLSPRQFRDPRLASTVASAVADAGIAPERLQLEITEGVLMGENKVTLDNLMRIKRLGARIAIDDFGTGYSSLSYLKKLPVDLLKIDRSFVADVPGDLCDESITQAVVAMAHELDLAVVAEGIERGAQARFLEQSGCDYGQGFLYGHPVPEAELQASLARAE